MKVYVVFHYNSFEEVMKKVFDSEEKALGYVKAMDETTDLGWMYIEQEVE